MYTCVVFCGWRVRGPREGKRMAFSSASAVAVDNDAVAEGRIGLFHLLLVLGQLAILFLIFRQFGIENSAFLQLAGLAFAGFAVHALLPLRYRMPFFLLLSFAGIALVFGFVNGAILVGIGLTLIAACHLPVSYRLRIAVVLLLATVLVALRAEWLPAIWSDAIWPILGSMFMFRLICYLYDLKHETVPASATRTLSYFFMLPNVCFPLFPVIDYKTFRRNYFDDDAYHIYQIGIDWMVRGVVHLLLYRYVYYYVTLAPAEVTNAGDLVQFVVSNFLLYLRVSGLFHLIVGMLYLFGFRLPETHHLYYLASGFSDLWRRINIYWKDFMLKVFYYPMVFRLRHLGATRAMVLATIFVFLMTWFLHAYQWFWLRGTVLFIPQDILFWAFLGVLVVLNALVELKRGRQRSLGNRKWTWQGMVRRVVQTLLTFSIICIIWSFWTSESVTAWLSMWSVLGENMTTAANPPSEYIFAAVALTVLQNANRGGNDGSRRFTWWPRWLDKRALTMGSLLILLVLGIEDLHSKIGGSFSTTITTLRSGQLSRLDQAKLERGYYENLLSVNRFNTELWEVYSKKPVNWLDVQGTGLKRFTNTFAQTENTPNFTSETEFGPYSVNRWGMRDKDYEKARPANTFRAAILGPSSVAGWGVGDGQTFEALLEDRLNREFAGAPFEHYEILNFGVPGYQPPQQIPALERALPFNPTAIFYVATGREASRAANYLAEVVRKEIPIPYAPLAAIVKKAGLTPSMEEATALRNLAPYKADILAWIYQRIAQDARAQGAVPVYFFQPQATAGSWQEETPEILRIATAADFIVIDMSDVFEGHTLESYTLAEWDLHSNDLGHQLIAEQMFEEVSKRQDQIFNKQ